MADENNLSEKLNQILSDPESIKNLMTLAGSFLGSGESTKPESPSASEETEPQAIPTIGKEVSSIEHSEHRHDEKRTRLLLALKPYLSRQRGERIDSILKILQLTEIAGLMKKL